MATRAERYKSEEQRANGGPKKGAHVAKKKPKKAAWSHEKGHAAGKTSHAIEATAPGKRPSRESTRGGANHAKPDSTLDRAEQAKKGTPTNRARKSRAVGTKVRGSS